MQTRQKKQLKTLIKNQSHVTVQEDENYIIVTRGKFSQYDTKSFSKYSEYRKILDDWIPCNKFSSITKNLFGILHGVYIKKHDFCRLNAKIDIDGNHRQLTGDGFFDLEGFKRSNIGVGLTWFNFYLGKVTLNPYEYLYKTQVTKQPGFNIDEGYKMILGETIRHSLCSPAINWGTWTYSYYLYGAEIFSWTLKNLQVAKFNAADLFISEEDPFKTGTIEIVANAIWNLIDIQDNTLEDYLDIHKIENARSLMNTDLIL